MAGALVGRRGHLTVHEAVGPLSDVDEVGLEGRVDGCAELLGAGAERPVLAQVLDSVSIAGVGG